MDFKRALVSPQKGTYCKSIRRLLEAERACFEFESHENSLQISLYKGINCLWTTNRDSNRNYFLLCPALPSLSERGWGRGL